MTTTTELTADIRERYQRIVGQWGADGVKRAAAVEAIAAELRTEGADLGDTYDQVVDAAVERLDDTDRAKQTEVLQWAAAALADETILGEQDPILDQVCAVGGGVRKAYRYLTEDDLLAIMERKSAHAAASAAAAAKVAEVVRALLAAMRAGDVSLLGDLYASRG